MYSASDLFTKAYSYATKKYDSVAILSAKHGLLLPDEEIQPYDLTLNNMSSDEVKAWSEKVFSQMKCKLNLSDFGRACFHTGNRYRKYLIPKLETMGIKCEVPLKNLGIGKQLAWYKQVSLV
jgi:hypothetical protein